MTEPTVPAEHDHLLKLAETGAPSRFGAPPVIRLTHEQLAGLVGATREATSKTLAEFAAKRLIKQARGRITIRSTEELRTISRRTS